MTGKMDAATTNITECNSIAVTIKNALWNMHIDWQQAYMLIDTLIDLLKET
ncbi:MAG: hypothetical protein V5789_00985 [Colwellia sp.]